MASSASVVRLRRTARVPRSSSLRARIVTVDRLTTVSCLVHTNITVTITANTLRVRVPKTVPKATARVAAATTTRIHVGITYIVHSVSIPLVYLRFLSYYIV